MTCLKTFALQSHLRLYPLHLSDWSARNRDRHLQLPPLHPQSFAPVGFLLPLRARVRALLTEVYMTKDFFFVYYLLGPDFCRLSHGVTGLGVEGGWV